MVGLTDAIPQYHRPKPINIIPPSVSANQGVSFKMKLTWKAGRETKETFLEDCLFFRGVSLPESTQNT